jgi:hypothetical protein
MGPLPAPAVNAAQLAGYRPFAAPLDEVPVLVWHGIGPARDGYTVTQAQFDRQVALLSRLGYTAISMRQWADFRAGHGALPNKPILLTFDDGRLDTYRGADRELRQAGMRAAMFVMTKAVEDGADDDLRWSELHRMARSGRWDVEPRAHAGATKVTITADGRQAPFYAARRYTRSAGQESLSGWEARVSEDLFAVRDRFTAQGFTPHAFSVPFGDYGQNATNDPNIPRLLSGLLTRQFGSFFVQDSSDPGFTTPGRGAASRFVVADGTTLDQLYRWLSEHSASQSAASSPRPQNAR